MHAPAPISSRDRDRARGSALLALVLTVPAPTIGVLAAMWWAPGPLGTGVFIALKGWMLMVPIAWRLLVERRGLSLSPVRRGGFGVAATLGVAISVVIIAAYALLGDRLIDADHARAMAAQNGIGTIPRYLVGVAYWVLVNSVLEEYVYRWFVFRQCERIMSARAAVVAAAACFTIHHVVALRLQFGWSVTILASFGTFVGGAVWSWLYLRYRSIWPGYLSHAIVDIAVFAVGWMILFGA